MSIAGQCLPSYVVIPARLSSTRLPRKLMLRESGKTVLQHTYEGASQAKRPMGVCIATEDDEIAREVIGFGGQVVLTDSGFATGTDRIARVAREAPFAGIEIIVNVQGDEPEISGEEIDRVIEVLEQDPEAQIATLAAPLRSREALENPACVKTVMSGDGRALYFSRAAVPHARTWDDAMLTENPPRFYQHVGLYAYRRDFLLNIDQVPPSRLEQTEMLEQLRFLDAGIKMAVGLVDHAVTGIDTRDDYDAFITRQRAA